MRCCILALGTVEWWLHFLFLLLFLLFFSTTLPLLHVLAEHVTITDQETGEVVLITSKRTTHLSDDMFQHVVGLWPHGDSRDNDAMFFSAEDAAYAKWVNKRRVLREQEEAAKGGASETKERTVSQSKLNITAFTPASVKARMDAREKSFNLLNNLSSLQDAWDAACADADYVHRLLHNDLFWGLTANVKGIAEEQYIHLVENVFSHTLKNITNSKSLLWTDELFYALQYPMLLGEEAVGLAEREVRSIARDIKRMEEKWRLMPGADDVSIDNASLKKVKKSLGESSAILGFARRAQQMVLELVFTLISHAHSSVSYQLRDTKEKIIKNDDSTSLLHQELKFLTKQKNRLTSSKKQLDNLERDIRYAKYRRMLLPKEAFVTALALIAKVRLEQNTGVETVDVVTGAGTCAAITATLWTELKFFVLQPLGMGMLIVATLSWVLLATRMFCLRRVQRSIVRERRAALHTNTHVHGHSKFSFVRLCFRVNLFFEILVPLIIPLLFLYSASKIDTVGGVSAYHVFIFARPAQRYALAILVAAALVVSFIVSSLVGLLYKYTSGVQAGVKAKKS